MSGKMGRRVGFFNTLSDPPLPAPIDKYERFLSPSVAITIPAMHTVILAIGTRGDVQPYLALAKRLQTDAGHRVSVATSIEFEIWVRGHGLGFIPMEGNLRELLAGEGFGKDLIHVNPVRMLFTIREMALPMLRQFFADAERACADADFVIWGFWGVPGYDVAQKMGIPSVAGLLQPWVRTHAFPTVGMPKQVNLGRWGNFQTHRLAEQSLWQIFRPQWNKWREKSLGLPRHSVRGPYWDMVKRRYPIMYGFSPQVVPRPADWGAHVAITGYWFLDSDPGWQPPADLARFLESGPPPVYIGFGSMATGEAEQLTEITLEALKQSGQRGLMLAGWGGLGQGETADHSVFVIDSAPHDWLFPRMAAVAHHGGSGTTGAGLRAGVPTLVIPHFADQPFWGWRVQKLGVGPKPIPRPQLGARKLAEAIREMATDTGMRDRAARLGEAIRAEDGIGQAIGVIQNLLK